MDLNDFDYYLPEELIAQEPLTQRDEARLLVVNRKNQTIAHSIFKDLHKHLPEKSCLVFNNSKVIPVRLLSQRASGAEVEIFLLKKLEDGYSYEVMMRPTKRLKVGEEIAFDDGQLIAAIVDKEKRIVRFNKKDILPHLERVGHIPLPPYIKRQDTADDREFYQTVYAKESGSVASPTAGLHFTTDLLAELKRREHQEEYVTLHVNYATFKAVEENDITKHPMHSEQYEIDQQAYDRIQQAKSENRKVIAIGTTSCRVLETLKMRGTLAGHTDIFIYPGKEFQMIDGLITNFHLPKTTLLMLVYAFAGSDLMRRAYQEAIKEKYRFFSYGDAMIII